jgi:hypothetical protein
MKSDDIKTIFSIYQIWLAEEKERIAADLRESKRCALTPSSASRNRLRA